MFRRIGSLASTLVLVATLVAVFASSAARAEPVVQLLSNGSSANRVDLIILGDGYTSAQMTKFRADAQRFADDFLTHTPFLEYKKYFNVWRIDTPSVQPGAGQNGRPRNTVYRAAFDCFNVPRLLCIEDARVKAVLNRNTKSNQQDMVMVLVNDPNYGGSGGPYAVATNATPSNIAVHEFGHSFGHLDDEYVDNYNCGRYTNPWGFNVTQKTARRTVPWTHWIAPATKVPNTPPARNFEDRGDPGHFKGAYFCASGWYRPTTDSLMNSGIPPFFSINTEQLVRRIYAFTAPLDTVRPLPGTITIPRAGTQEFRATPIDAALNVEYTWRINGVAQPSRARTLTVRGNSFGASATLELTVKDATAMVRKDPGAVTIARKTWTLKRGA
jgi:hypothetical protein